MFLNKKTIQKQFTL